MNKILKNTTESNISLVNLGRTVNSNSQLTVEAADYDILSSPESLLEIAPLLSAGTIVVNDGVDDLSAVDGIALLQGSYTNPNSELVENNRIKVDVVGSLSDGKVLASSNDSVAGYLEDKIIAENNKVTVTTANDGADEDITIGINPANIGTTEINNDANFITAAQAPVQTADLADFETSSELNARDTINRNRSNHTGTQTSSTISNFNSAVVAAETTTTLDFNNTTKVLTYTNEDGAATNVDLTQFLDDTNLARINSGTLDAVTGIATFTRDDNTTFTVDMSSLNDQAAISAAIAAHEAASDPHPQYAGGSGSQGFKDFIRDGVAKGTQGTTFTERLSLSTTLPNSGNYKISWSYEWSLNSTQNDIEVRVQVDNSTTILNHIQEPKDAGGGGETITNLDGGTFNTGTDQRYVCSGFDIINLTAGSHVIDLDMANQVSGTEAAIYKAVISIEEF